MVQGHEKESLSIGRRGEEVRGQQPQPSDIFFLCEGQNLVWSSLNKDKTKSKKQKSSFFLPKKMISYWTYSAIGNGFLVYLLLENSDGTWYNTQEKKQDFQ